MVEAAQHFEGTIVKAFSQIAGGYERAAVHVGQVDDVEAAGLALLHL